MATLRVTSKHVPYHRCGLHFIGKDKKPSRVRGVTVEAELSDFTPDQVRRLCTDPHLKVDLVDHGGAKTEKQKDKAFADALAAHQKAFDAAREAAKNAS